jgi:hypothetical protein
MPTLFSIRNLNLALCLSLLAGCAQYNSGWSGYSPSYHDPYSQSDFDELLTFGANLARISPSARAETCRVLLKHRKDSPAAAMGIQLHLMVGRLLSDACGDIPGILNGVASVPAGHLPDERTRKLVDIHIEALRRMNSQPRRFSSQERKYKAVPNGLETQESPGSRKSENRLLREKLEAIRSMEKQMDQSRDEN